MTGSDETFHASFHGQHITLWNDCGEWSWADGHGCTEGGFSGPVEAIAAYADSECERHQSAMQCAADARIWADGRSGGVPTDGGVIVAAAVASSLE